MMSAQSPLPFCSLPVLELWFTITAKPSEICTVGMRLAIRY